LNLLKLLDPAGDGVCLTNRIRSVRFRWGVLPSLREGEIER